MQESKQEVTEVVSLLKMEENLPSVSMPLKLYPLGTGANESQTRDFLS